jgi:serine/threonine protein kinase
MPLPIFLYRCSTKYLSNLSRLLMFWMVVSFQHVQVERMILGEVEKLPKGIERENRIIQTIMRQILFALDGLHSTGIVHRDIKPQNIIFSQGYSLTCF